MRIHRNRLLILIPILVIVASFTPTGASAELVKAVGIADPSWNVKGSVLATSGEPDTGGNTVPPYQPRINVAGQSRGDALAMTTRDVRVWLTWVGRFWTGRILGTAF